LESSRGALSVGAIIFPIQTFSGEKNAFSEFFSKNLGS
jgi:hypothetical protein